VTAEIISDITSSLVLNDVLTSVARRTVEVLDLWECDIYDYRAGEQCTAALALWAREPHAADGDWVGSTHTLVEQPSFARALGDCRMIENRIDDPALPDVERRRMEFWNEQSCLLVPLVFKGEAIGCLELVEKRYVRHFGTEERELAVTMAALAAVAIQNARLYGDVEHLAITDGLTGLYNHRYFYDRLAQEVARAQRYDLPLSLLMIDIDDFKAYNDRSGHRAGDALLRQLGVVLRSQTRQQIDLVARYGGEEFAVILPSTGVTGAARAGQRLRDAINEEGLAGGDAADFDGARRAADAADFDGTRRAAGAPDPGAEARAAGADSGGDSGAAHAVGERIRRSVAGQTFGTAEQPPVITVSVGVASLPEHATTADALVDQADAALYRAKRAGKNRVEVERAGAGAGAGADAG
jgi:diguanylate cyclase (GGDEF)-like protein